VDPPVLLQLLATIAEGEANLAPSA
jgi:hypothetical protein